jgi:hypothetical protein
MFIDGTDITFPSLVDLLCDTEREIPEWLAASEAKLDQYNPKQFNAIVKLVEARYWLGSVEHICDQFWAWQIVFGQPRLVHRQMMSKRDAQALVALKGAHGRFSFTNSMPKYYYEDFPDAYKVLRDTLFPDGIDDAIPAFTKHFRQSKTSVLKLRKRITALEKAKVISRTCSLFQKSSKILVEADQKLKKTMTMARRWCAATKAQREYFQLPGVDLGLTYGEDFFADYDENTAYVIHTPREGGGKHWDSNGPLYTPIRWRSGSPWLDYFRNTRQDHPALRRFDDDELEAMEVDDTLPGPLELRLPQSIVNIWLHYARMYSDYDDEFTVSN